MRRSGRVTGARIETLKVLAFISQSECRSGRVTGARIETDPKRVVLWW